MRNDIAFIEAAYAAMRLGAYAVPVNWHFKPEEVNYVLKDSGTSVLIGHADKLHGLRGAIPAGVTVQGRSSMSRSSVRNSRPRLPATRCQSTSKSSNICRARIPARFSSG